MTDLQRSLIALVRAGMEENDFSQDDLAFLTQKSAKHISQMMRGKTMGTLTSWQQLLDLVGVDMFKVDPAPDEFSRPGPFRCKVEGCTSPPAKSRKVMWQHVKGIHDMTLDAYIAEYGELVPMTPGEVASLVVEAVCPICGDVYSTATGTRYPRSALVSHMWGRHGVKA